MASPLTTSLHDLTSEPPTDPLELYRLRDGFYATDLLAAALVHLDLFTRLADQPMSLDDVCREFGLTRRPTDVMMTLFTALNLTDRRDDVFHLSPLARDHLVKSSPWFIGPYYAALKDRPVCLDYVKVLQTDKPANWGSYRDEKDWTRAMEEPAFADQFTAAMDCRGVCLGPAAAKAVDCAGQKQLLDVAGGSGIYACAFVARHPHLGATVLEKPPVDRVARRAIAKRGFADRVTVEAGDMFAGNWPTGFDVHLISNVLHDWDEAPVRQLLAESARSLAPGGLLVIHDAHLNENKSGPLPVAKYSALLMHATPGKCYAVSEMRAYLSDAGFMQVKFQETAVDRSVITARLPS
jgi:SAM-dependent methyltransferase